jgi:hypothetical protein
MNSDSDLNPYAPPLSAVDTVKSDDAQAAVRRPASVKWTMAVMILFFGAAAYGFSQRFVKDGWEDASQSYFGTFQGLLRVALVMAPLALIFGGRRIIAYAVGVLALAALSSVFAWGIWTTDFHFDTAEARGEALTAGVVTVVTCWLFIRFTFGRPSRSYFRIAKP